MQGGGWIFPRRGLMMAMLLLVAMTGTGLAQNWRPMLRSDDFIKVFMLNATQGWAVGDAGLAARTSDGGATWTYEATGTIRDLVGVWASSSTDVWAVGMYGTILRWDGSTWNLFNSGTTNHLYAVHGSSAGNVWIVGESVRLRWNGTTLTTFSNSATTYDVFALATDNVWAVGASGWYRFNGTSWVGAGSSTYDLRGIHGVDANNIWAVGEGGTIMRWNGSTWAAQSSGINEYLRGVWAQDVNNVWAVGVEGIVLKWNGTSWQRQETGVTSTLISVWGSGVGGPCVAGIGGLLTQWDGSQWTIRARGQSGLSFSSMAAADASHVWAATGFGVWKWDGTRARVDLPGFNVTGLWAGSATHVWAVGGSSLAYRWNGTDWSQLSLTGSPAFSAVFGLDETNVWLVGTGGIFKWNGTALANQSTTSFTNGHALNANNAWVVGGSGRISQWNGSAWTAQTSGTTSTLNAVFALDASNVWAVGDGGTIRKWNGTAWTVQVSNTTTALYGVWAQDVNNVWATGLSGLVQKWNGSVWAAAPGVTNGTSGRLSATSVHNMWTGANGALMSTQPAAGPAPDLAVTVAGAAVADDGAAAPFAVTAAGETAQKVFTITNTGTDTLSGLALAKSGTAAANFALGSLGAVTLIPGASTTFSITFTAPATTPASAQVQISSNAPGAKSSYDISLSGQILSATADTDADGMNDAAELKLAALGFDWQTTQTALVSGYYAHATAARLYNETQYNASRAAGQNDVLSAPNTHGLYTPTQVQALHAGTPLLQRHASTGEFTVTLGLQKSADLSHFSPFPVTVPQTTVNAQGQVELKFTVPDNTAFFRLQAQ